MIKAYASYVLIRREDNIFGHLRAFDCGMRDEYLYAYGDYRVARSNLIVTALKLGWFRSI